VTSHTSTPGGQPGQVAIVSGCDISGYGIVRSLGRAGVTSLVISDSDHDFGRLSKYCKGHFPFPAIKNGSAVAFRPVPESGPVVERLLAFAAQCAEPPVLFATSDWFTSLVVNHRSELSPYFRYHWLAAETFASMCDKARVSQFVHASACWPPERAYCGPETV
jgi:D-aspartate ligase